MYGGIIPQHGRDKQKVEPPLFCSTLSLEQFGNTTIHQYHSITLSSSLPSLAWRYQDVFEEYLLNVRSFLTLH